MDDHDEEATQKLAEMVSGSFAGIPSKEKTGRIYLLVDERMLDEDFDISDLVATGFYLGSSKNDGGEREERHKSGEKVI